MKKKLSQEDAQVWSEYSKGLKKLPDNGSVGQYTSFKPDENYTVKPSLKKPAGAIDLGENHNHEILSDIFSDKRIDKKKLRELKRGRIQPEAKLDLHGLKRFEAQEKVKEFVEVSIQKKLRLVLIITGKGKRSSDTLASGVLRKEFPRWISSLPQAKKILCVVQASASHGGSGAFYVYMRRPLQN